MKLRRLSIFFIIISMFVITGHAMIPHNHNHDNTSKVDSLNYNHHSLFEKLKEIFSVNVGVEHLDEYNQTNSINIETENSILHILLIGYQIKYRIQIENKKVFFTYSFPFNSSQITKGVGGLRAPPFMN